MESKKAPLYEKRKLIVAGELKDFAEYTPKFDETHNSLVEQAKKIVKTSDEDKPKEVKEIDVEPLKGKDGIPDFWFRAIKNNQMVYELVKEKDEEILKHVTHVEATKTVEPRTLTVKF
jgi:Txe/YoeB family toxin of Txe-Axe toxin-antitoxin module